MKIYAYILAALAIFMSGYFFKDAKFNKELAHAIQKAEQRFETTRTRQEGERHELEKKIAKDRQLADQRLRELTQENDKLRAEASAYVSVELLVFAGLCDTTEECTLLYRKGTDKTSPPTEGLVTAAEIYRLLRTLDEIILQHNLGLEQLNQQLEACRL